MHCNSNMLTGNDSMARNASMMTHQGQSKPQQTTSPKPQKKLDDDEILAQSVLESAGRRRRSEVSFREKAGGGAFMVPAVFAEVLRHIRQGFLPSL